MFARFSNSWELVKASWEVLKADKELIVFPIVSFIGVVIVTITFMVPMALSGLFEALAGEGTAASSGASVIGFVFAFLFYVVVYTVVIFSNSALVGAAMIRMEGGDPTIRDGFRIASEHMASIVGYAIISATVGMILRAISERGGIVGQIASSLFGFAWNLATFLVIPVLVIEDVGPVEAVKRSTSLLKRTWGEQIMGNMSIGLVFGLLTIGVAIVVGVPVMFVVSATGSPLLIGLGIAVIVLAVIAVSMLGSTLNGIYTAAVYRYAVDGQVSGFFSEELIQSAFKPK